MEFSDGIPTQLQQLAQNQGDDQITINTHFATPQQRVETIIQILSDDALYTRKVEINSQIYTISLAIVFVYYLVQVALEITCICLNRWLFGLIFLSGKILCDGSLSYLMVQQIRQINGLSENSKKKKLIEYQYNISELEGDAVQDSVEKLKYRLSSDIIFKYIWDQQKLMKIITKLVILAQIFNIMALSQIITIMADQNVNHLQNVQSFFIVFYLLMILSTLPLMMIFMGFALFCIVGATFIVFSVVGVVLQAFFFGIYIFLEYLYKRYHTWRQQSKLQDFRDQLKEGPYQDLGINDTVCTICLQNYSEDETVSILPCNNKLPSNKIVNHNFHTTCINMWFSTQGNCPICRQIFF